LNNEPLARIAAALERLVPPAASPVDWHAAPAYLWRDDGAVALTALAAPELGLLTGIDEQKAAFHANAARHAAGHAAHDVLLWGARGMGKSALVKASIAALQAEGAGLALVETGAGAGALAGLAPLFAALAPVERRFIVFLDDIGFDGPEASTAARALRSLLEGGALARPANVRIAATSNRRAIVERQMAEQDDPINPRDARDDRLALADRFGLSLGFHACDQDRYLAIVGAYAAAHGLAFDQADALAWAHQRGARSGRVAWHYIVELAGRAGRAV